MSSKALWFDSTQLSSDDVTGLDDPGDVMHKAARLLTSPV